MKIVAIIQARMGSTRLPHKVLKQLCGKSVIEHIVDRINICKNIDNVIVATTKLEEDNAIVDECENLNALIFRGDNINVLSRYYNAAKDINADIIVRVTADCPLLDPYLLSEMIKYFNEIKPDYLSNCIKKTFPRGLDIEIFTFKTLEKAYKNATKEFEKEHVTPYIYQNAEDFKIDNFLGARDHSDHRWTIDTKEDFMLIDEIYKNLYKKGQIFSTSEVLAFLKKNPHLLKINKSIKQKTLEKL